MFRKTIFSFFFLLIMLGGICFSALAETFVEGLEDIPLMQGLTQLEDENISFDVPEGAFKSIKLETKTLTQKEILTFYEESLKNLGWRKTAKNTYERENLTLHESFEREGKKLLLIFELTTKSLTKQDKN